MNKTDESTTGPDVTAPPAVQRSDVDIKIRQWDGVPAVRW